MIEFVSLCVCSACLSCLCCLITGGLCILPSSVRLRNKIVEKHLPGGMQWLGNLPPSEVYENWSSSSSDCCPVSRDCPKDHQRSSHGEKTAEGSRHRAKKCSCINEANNKFWRREKKHSTVKSCDKSSPKRWTFCFRMGKSRGNSSECCVPIIGENGNAIPEETPEPKSSSHRKSKKSRTRKNGSKTYCAYFKSCSCTSVREPSEKWHRKKHKRSEMSPAKYPSECNREKRRSRTSRKSKTRPKNCRCKIIADEKTSVIEEKCCKCGANHTSKKRRCSKSRLFCKKQ